MKVLKGNDGALDSCDEIAEVLARGGLVCMPCNGSYRLLADLRNADAVTSLLQSKRRTGKSAALVFVADEAMLDQVAAEIAPAARALAREMWPGPLTILFDARDDLLPKRTMKQLLKANGKLGIRIPDDGLAHRVVTTFGGPVLVSSANRQKRAGESSPAQVRKNFVHQVDLFLDHGDLREQTSSTVVDIAGDGSIVVTRPGAIDADRIAAIVD